ncbi:MAG: hypothetical protein F4X83_03640 [Chloroflexi bacterium]|nr:hypothetical protein [Chloroflexota bacterium]
MIYSILTPISKRLRNRSNALLAAVIGLVAMAALVSCATVNLNELSGPATQPSADDAQSRQTRSPASLLVRKFEPRYETNISLLQYEQADEYLRVTAPSEIGVPVLLSTRYAQTEHMPILVQGDGRDFSTRRFVDWGFISFAADFDKHVHILEGRFANPAKPGDPFIEAVMTTEKLDEIGAKVGDHLILVYRHLGRDPEPIEVKIVGSWSPLDPKDVYWFYEPPYFNEGLMVPEETYIDVILPSWREIGYEYTWYTVYNAGESDIDAINTGISQIRADLAAIFGEVKIHVWPPDILTQSEERSNSQ